MPVGTNPDAVAAADLNGDGRADVVTANGGSGDVSVLLGDGAGGFAAAKTFASGPHPVGVAVGDMDGDGRLDLAVVNRDDSTVAVLRGAGDGTFAAAVT